MKEIDLKQIKSMEELKKELGNKYDEIMYDMNLELLERINKAMEFVEKNFDLRYYDVIKETDVFCAKPLYAILKGSDKE